MSRIGKSPVTVPDKVDVTINETTNEITVKGPLGTMSRKFRREVSFKQDGNVIIVSRVNDERMSRSLHGLSRTLLNNMVVGVKDGFTKNLELVGVGYRANVQGTQLNLLLGYSKPVELKIPQGIEVKVEANTKVAISGYDKQQLGEFTALIRSYRPPEPYKGKGIRFAGEKVRRKAGKAGKK